MGIVRRVVKYQQFKKLFYSIRKTFHIRRYYIFDKSIWLTSLRLCINKYSGIPLKIDINLQFLSLGSENIAVNCYI